MSPAELNVIARALRSETGDGRAAHTIPWALAQASPDIRTQVLSQLAAPTRLLYRAIWLLGAAAAIPGAVPALSLLPFIPGSTSGRREALNSGDIRWRRLTSRP